jgi:hypothetical protein
VASDNGFKKPGDLDLDAVDLITSTGQVIDLGSMVQEINVYENIFDHYIQCDVLLSDSLKLLDSMGVGFTGTEILVLSYKNKGDNSDKFRRNAFRIYAVNDRQRIKESVEVYSLAGISAESYETAPMRVKSALGGTSGKTITSMVQKVYNQYVQTAEIKSIHSQIGSGLKINVNKQLLADETSGLHKFVIPSMTVDETLDFLSSEADSEDHVPYFIFFENADGFNFKNLSSLTQQDPVGMYFYLFNNVLPEQSEDSKYHDAYRIIAYNVVSHSNMYSNLQTGMLKSRTVNVDLHRKRMTEKKYDYENYASRFKQMGKFAIPGAVGETTDPVINLMTSRTGHDIDSAFEAEKPVPKKTNDVVNLKRAYSQSIFNTIVEVTLHGNSELKVGDTIFLQFPFSTDIETDKSHSSDDKYLTGKYLITKVRQKISGESFVSVLECSKDGKAS